MWGIILSALHVFTPGILPAILQDRFDLFLILPMRKLISREVVTWELVDKTGFQTQANWFQIGLAALLFLKNNLIEIFLLKNRKQKRKKNLYVWTATATGHLWRNRKITLCFKIVKAQGCYPLTGWVKWWCKEKLNGELKQSSEWLLVLQKAWEMIPFCS